MIFIYFITRTVSDLCYLLYRNFIVEEKMWIGLNLIIVSFFLVQREEKCVGFM